MASFSGCTGSNSGDGGSNKGGAKTSNQVDGPIKIGTLSPTQEKVYGVTIPNGARIAVEEINQNGGVLGANLELVVKDTKGDPQTAKSKFRELTLKDEVDLILGPLASESAINVMPQVADSQTVTMNTASSTTKITKQVTQNYDTYKHLFRTGPINGYYQGLNMLDFAKAYFDKMGWKSVAYVSEGRSWSKTQHKIVSDRLDDTVDANVTKVLRYSGDTEDFTSIYDRVQNSGADGMFSSTAYQTVPAVSQWAKQKRPFGFVGNHTGLMPSMIYSALKGAARYTTSLTFGSVPGVALTDRTIPFQEAYNKKFDGYPSYPAYPSYDAVQMFAKAAEGVKSLNPSRTISELEGMVFQGSSGVIEFNGPDSEFRHDAKYGPDRLYPVWFQWQEKNGSGKQVAIWPDDISQGSYQRPRWI